MIKRLAHRNANVQLYTLEVRLRYLGSWTTGADSWALVGKCLIAELWEQYASGVVIKELYRRYAAVGERQSTLRIDHGPVSRKAGG